MSGDVSCLRYPNHCDPLTFDEQIELERQMDLILQVPDRPEPRNLLAGEWENVQRLAETCKAYRETNDPHAVNDSLPKRVVDENKLTRLDDSNTNEPTRRQGDIVKAYLTLQCASNEDLRRYLARDIREGLAKTLLDFDLEGRHDD